MKAMTITAAEVKQLRERTGAGMMECKKALVETGGDLDAAVDLMRKSGLAKADKKAGRVAAEGLIAISNAGDAKTAAIVEVNCETDFVAGGDEFAGFAKSVAEAALESTVDGIDSLMQQSLDGGISVEETRRNLIAKIGENINVRRVEKVMTDDRIGVYTHGRRIGVLVAMTGGNEDLAKHVAMHIAASNPAYVGADDIPGDVLAKEKEILSDQARNEGKPEQIVAKMVEGRLRKYLAEVTLLGQPFVMDEDVTVSQLLEREKAAVTGFVRFEVGEGIEKKQENFVEEVMAQARGE
jgi:elongation factor Ts